ncbi:MAG: leucine-rich repeat domain-containing protein [Bradyrhizobium sp.]|uniref:leucine-rich repeat domain-containing protein n=1 Tax=Bradyrhizobium sp. TaxID=376 RepID=UPI0025C1198C|nr:hypothetical protein [Bradyrhizobium sp.]MBI5263940.1 leucine-rich repeat domain-containing protein [Bradyrhizobium sp.]
MAEYLLSMAEAFQRFMPEVDDIACRTMTYSRLNEFKAGVVEGDIVVAKEGMVLTTELVSAFENERLGALFVTGSLLAPNATIAEPEIEWSPLLKVKGNVVTKNLCLAGSASEIDGDVTADGVLFGFYNHGQMRIRGTTKAELILASDYEFIFDGPVERKHVASWDGRLNIPVDYERERLDRILVPAVLDETNFIHDDVVLDRLSRGLPILRPEAEIGSQPQLQLSEKGEARLTELRARRHRGEEITRLDFKECGLRFAPDQLKEFAGARELVLSKNRIRKLPAWIGSFAQLEVLKLEDCGLATLPRKVAQLPRLRRLELAENPIKSLPFGPDSFRALEILSIGEIYSSRSADFTANLDLSLFPSLRVVEQRYEIDAIEYRDSHDLWNNPQLEILDIGWAALTHGLPAGLLRAKNLRALATKVNKAQLNSVLCRMPAFERLEYLAIGYTDLSSRQLSQLHDALPRAFISCSSVDGKHDYDFPEWERLSQAERDFRDDRTAEALAALDEMTSSLDLRRPLVPFRLHAKLMMLAVKVRWVAADEEQDRGRRQAMAESALQWADRVLSILPAGAEGCWYLDAHELWLVRLQCFYGRAVGHALRASPDPVAATAALDAAQEEVDRFLLPVLRDGKETAIIRSLRARIPD